MKLHVILHQEILVRNFRLIQTLILSTLHPSYSRAGKSAIPLWWYWVWIASVETFFGKKTSTCSDFCHKRDVHAFACHFTIGISAVLFTIFRIHFFRTRWIIWHQNGKKTVQTEPSAEFSVHKKSKKWTIIVLCPEQVEITGQFQVLLLSVGQDLLLKSPDWLL